MDPAQTTRLPNPAEGEVRLHNPATKPKKAGSRARNPAGFKADLMTVAVPIIAGGFLATFVVQAKQWVQAKTGWDARAMAWAQLAAVVAGAYGMMYALKQPWGRKHRVEVLVAGTALLTPLAVDAAAVIMPETATHSPAQDATGRRHHRGGAWGMDAPTNRGLTTDIEYGGLTTDIEYGAVRKRRQYN